MKKLIFFTFILASCSSITKKNTDYSILKCNIIEIDEYQYAFRFMALKEKDTILIVSPKENYYDKYGYKKPNLKHLKEIKVNKKYVFHLVEKKSTVSTMEQMGAFIVIENDTLWKSKNYKEVPISFISYNTIGKLYGN